MAIFGSVFANRLSYWLPRSVPSHLLGHLSPTALQASPAAIHTLPPAVRDGVAQAVAHSVATVFLIAAPIAALGFLVVLLLKEYPLRTWGQKGANPADRGAEKVSTSHEQHPQETPIPASAGRSISQA